MDNKKLLGKRIKEIRKHKGYTQEQLSELIEIETSSLSGIESGRFFPSLHVLDKMSSVLEIELVEFFKFSSIDIPQDIEGEVLKMIQKQDSKSKQLIYKLVKAGFSTVS